jgi:hypothetical protein
MNRIIVFAVVLCALSQASTDGISGLARAADGTTADKAREAVLKIDDLYPVYGPCGSRRHTTFVAGEQMHFAAKISGIAVNRDGGCNVGYTSRLLYPSAKPVEGQSRSSLLQKDSLVLGSDTATVYFSLNTPLSAPVGKYNVQLEVGDFVGNQLKKKEIEINVLDKVAFRILNASLYRDLDFLYASSGNVTLGEHVYVRFDLRIPKNKNNEVLAETSITVFDRTNRQVLRLDLGKTSERNVTGNGMQFRSGGDCWIPETGTYRIHIEAKDPSTNKSDECDLPVVVHNLPGVFPATVERVETGSQSGVKETGASRDNGVKDTLLVEAYPTWGGHGSRRDATFISGEEMFFGATIGGLTGNADRESDCTLEFSMVNSNPSAPLSEKERAAKLTVRRLLLSGKHSSMLPLWCECEFEPGHYTARFVAKDNRANRTASKDMAITVVDNDVFAAGGAGLSYDRERKVWAGYNVLNQLEMEILGRLG